MLTDAALTLKYRPASFRDVVGQLPVQAVLNRSVNAPDGTPHDPCKLYPAMVFHGPRGSGKTSTARIVAAAVNCESPGRRPCGQCSSCEAVRARRHPDLLEVDAASYGTTDDIRRLQESVSYAPAGRYKVVILDEAHAMSRSAFNALLKLLEEPPEQVIFILATTERTKVLGTVGSRCMPFAFKTIAPADIVKRLAYICAGEGAVVETGMLQAIAEQADGGMRDAVVALDQALTAGLSTLAGWQQFTGYSDYAPGLVEAMAAGNHALLFSRLEQVIASSGDFQAICSALTACLRDILVLAAGGSCTSLGEALVARQNLAAQIDARRAAAAMRVLWDLRRTLPAGHQRAAIDMAVVLVSEKLHPFPAAASNGNGVNGHSKLSVAQMRELAATG